jgi:hypothetical protein
VKKIVVITALLLMVPALSPAQDTDTDRPPRGLGYVFVGGATHSMGLTTGVGGEVYSSTGLGAGLELGAAGLTTKGDSYYKAYYMGVGSADASYHYFSKKTESRVSPFAAGGYTILFGHNASLVGKDVTTNGYNVGGGVDVLATKHAGVRFDVRYYGHGGHILKNRYPDVAEFSFVAFRVAFTFR